MAAIAEVRKRTMAPLLGCRKALEINEWDVDKACHNIAKAVHEDKVGNGKSHDSHGIVALYSHEFGRIGVMVEVSCESSYVAKSRDFIKMANTIAIHVAWSNPKYVSRADVDPREIEAARDNFSDTIGSGPEWAKVGKLFVSDGMVDSAMESHFYPKMCLLDQPEMKESQGQETIGELISRMSMETGEKISVRRFSRFRIGDHTDRVV